jgi:hypothetical protein
MMGKIVFAVMLVSGTEEIVLMPFSAGMLYEFNQGAEITIKIGEKSYEMIGEF